MVAPCHPLVSFIVPCYNQGHFLAEAIESLLSQTWREFEIIVINDGSTDHTAEIAARYSEVRYFYQANKGRSAARNFGASLSRGKYLVFLDADDKLLPDALENGLCCYQENPDYGFVYGRYELIAGDGTLLPPPPRNDPDEVCYRAFLLGNRVGMLGAALFRRSVFDEAGGFDHRLQGCEDYDLFLRIARTCQVAKHNQVVALYRHHGANTTLDARLMLSTAISVLNAQRPYIKGRLAEELAWQEGMAFMRSTYGYRLLAEVQRDLASLQNWPRAFSGLAMLMQYQPGFLLDGLVSRLRTSLRPVSSPSSSASLSVRKRP